MTNIGTVQSISGLVVARTLDGKSRELGAGDIVFQNEVIEVAAGGNVTLSLFDGSALSLNEYEKAFLDESVVASVDATEAVVEGVTALQEALVAALDNNEDIEDLLEETAAGNSGVTDFFDYNGGYHAGDVTSGEVGAYLLGAGAVQPEQQNNLVSFEIATQDDVPVAVDGDTDQVFPSTLDLGAVGVDTIPPPTPPTIEVDAKDYTEGSASAGDLAATYLASGEDGAVLTVDFTVGTNLDGYYDLINDQVVLTQKGVDYLDAGNELPPINLTVNDGQLTGQGQDTPGVTFVDDNPIANDFSEELNSFSDIIPISFDPDTDKSRISDEEDDKSSTDSKELDTVVITSVPLLGSLYYDGRLITEQDVTNRTEFDYDKITYQTDSGGGVAPGTVLLGIKGMPDSNSDPDGDGFFNWGVANPNDSKEHVFTTDGGNEILISSDSGPLKQNNHEAGHIGHGISDKDGQGINKGESIDIDFGSQTMTSLELGLDGMGGLFEAGDKNSVLITISYQDPDTQASSKEVVEYQKPVGATADHGIFQVVTVGDGESFDIDTHGKLITDISFSTTKHGNWELRYVEGQLGSSDGFKYIAVDSDGLESAEAKVTINYDIPIAYGDTVVTDEETVLVANVPESTHPEDDIAQDGYVLDGAYTGKGNLTFNEDGSYTFDPGSDFDSLRKNQSEEVSFSYTVKDGDGSVSAPATVTILVTGKNEPSNQPDPDDDNIAGDDTANFIDGGAGADKIAAGGGDDTIIFDKDDTSIDGGDGFDTLIITDPTIDFSGVNVTNIEKIELASDQNQKADLSMGDVLRMTDDSNALEFSGGEGDVAEINDDGYTPESTAPDETSEKFSQDGSSPAVEVTVTSTDDTENQIKVITDDGTAIG